MATKILLAEDNDDYVRILNALFLRSGYELIHVKSGTDAYEFLKKRPLPDLLISDVMMPGMSGFELLKRLKEDNITLPIIMVTSKQTQQDVLQGFQDGALDYITKPFSPAVLLARVKNALARKTAG
jgi:DNA-binding response OmpR family regulator